MHDVHKPTVARSARLVARGRRRRYNAKGTTLFAPTRPNDLWCADYKVGDRIWLVSFMDYDSGFFDHEKCLESVENPFAAKVLPMSPERTLKYWCRQ